MNALPEVDAGCYEEKPGKYWWSPFDGRVEVETSGDRFAVGHGEDVNVEYQTVSSSGRGRNSKTIVDLFTVYILREYHLKVVILMHEQM